MSKPRVALIVPLLGSWEEASHSLFSAGDWEVIAVANGCPWPGDDAVRGMVKGGIIWERYYRQRSLASCYNIGVDLSLQSGAEIVCLGDESAIYPERWVEILAAGLDYYDVVGPLLDLPDGFQSVGTHCPQSDPGDDPDAVRGKTGYMPVANLSHRQMMMRAGTLRNLLTSHGDLFDESLMAGTGDMLADLHRRIGEAGMIAGVALGVYVHHYRSPPSLKSSSVPVDVRTPLGCAPCRK